MVCFMQSWKKMSYCCLILAPLSQMVISVSAYVYSQETLDIYKYCGWNVKDVGCPIHNDNYWDCLRHEIDCPDGTEYHCARLFENKTKFVDGCAPKKTCLQGEAPYLNREKNGEPTEDFHITCDWCYGDTYNSMNRLSTNYSECWNKIRCDPQHGMQCVPENIYDKYMYKQDRLCRCDARNNYVLSDSSRLNGKICTSDGSIASHCIKKEPCGKNKERLLNYTCAEKCENGYRSEKSDDCIRSPSQGDPQSTDKPSVTEDLNYTTENITTTTIPATSKSVSSSTEHVLTSPTPYYVKTIVKHVPEYTSTIVVGAIALLIIVVIAALALIIYRKYRKRNQQRRSERDFAPEPNITSVEETFNSSPSQRRRSIRLAYRLPNGHEAPNAPLADHTGGRIIILNSQHPVTPHEEPMSAAFLFSQTPQQPLPARTGNTTHIREQPLLEPTVKEMVKRQHQQSPQPSSSRGSENGMERKGSWYAQKRRRSSSFDNLGLAIKYSPPPLKSYQSQWGLDKKTLDDVAKRTLNKHLEELLQCLQPDAILNKFVEDKFMREIDIRDIREQNTTTQKIRKIIDAVLHKGYEGYAKLMEIVRTNQLDIYKVHREFLMGVEECRAQPEKYQTEDETDHDTDDPDIDADMIVSSNG